MHWEWQHKQYGKFNNKVSEYLFNGFLLSSAGYGLLWTWGTIMYRFRNIVVDRHKVWKQFLYDCKKIVVALCCEEIVERKLSAVSGQLKKFKKTCRMVIVKICFFTIKQEKAGLLSTDSLAHLFFSCSNAFEFVRVVCYYDGLFVTLCHKNLLIEVFLDFR